MIDVSPIFLSDQCDYVTYRRFIYILLVYTNFGGPGFDT
jgi:hypothetical protein